jgi:formylglycine-generating enzyme required for sulfatase activity
VNVYTSGSPSFGSALTTPVTVAPFKIAKYETTELLYYDVQGWAANSQYNYLRGGVAYSLPYAYYSLEPKANIDWATIAVFCNALSEMTGKEPVYRNTNGTVARDYYYTSGIVKQAGANGYRLPTTIEWEFAARGGVPSSTSSAAWNYAYAGTNAIGNLSYYAVYNLPSGSTSTVGSKSPNSLDLYDMSGNLEEWCEERNATQAYAAGGYYLVSPSNLELLRVSSIVLKTMTSSTNSGLRLVLD